MTILYTGGTKGQITGRCMCFHTFNLRLIPMVELFIWKDLDFFKAIFLIYMNQSTVFIRRFINHSYWSDVNLCKCMLGDGILGLRRNEDPVLQ